MEINLTRCVFEMKNDDDDEPLGFLHDHQKMWSILMGMKFDDLMMRDDDDCDD